MVAAAPMLAPFDTLTVDVPTNPRHGSAAHEYPFECTPTREQYRAWLAKRDATEGE